MEFGPRIAQLTRRALLWHRTEGALEGPRPPRRRHPQVVQLTVSSDGGALSAALDIEPVEGVADSGDLANDLTDLFVGAG